MENENDTFVIDENGDIQNYDDYYSSENETVENDTIEDNSFIDDTQSDDSIVNSTETVENSPTVEILKEVKEILGLVSDQDEIKTENENVSDSASDGSNIVPDTENGDDTVIGNSESPDVSESSSIETIDYSSYFQGLSDKLDDTYSLLELTNENNNLNSNLNDLSLTNTLLICIIILMLVKIVLGFIRGLL